MKAYITQINYCIPLTKEQWERLNEIDEKGDDRWDEIKQKMDKAGASNLEWNGHFGRNFFFSIEKEKHLGRVLKVLERIVKPS